MTHINIYEATCIVHAPFESILAKASVALSNYLTNFVAPYLPIIKNAWGMRKSGRYQFCQIISLVPDTCLK
jgi:hypothetical protein